MSELDNVQELAERFVRALIARQWPAARGLLAPALQGQWSQEDLERAWDNMLYEQRDVVYMPEIIAVDAMDGWKAREAGDAGWAYVPVVSEECNEAIAVIVAQQSGGALAIRTLEFGRP